MIKTRLIVAKRVAGSSLARLVAAAALCMTIGCDGGPTSPSPSELRGGVLLTFRVVGEPFKVWITNPTTIDRALALQQGSSRASIPIGPLQRDAGRGAHNAPYAWHLDPETTQLVDAAIEVCDGTPTLVERNLDYFVNVVRAYCPWAAQLIRFDDYR